MFINVNKLANLTEIVLTVYVAFLYSSGSKEFTFFSKNPLKVGQVVF